MSGLKLCLYCGDELVDHSRGELNYCLGKHEVQLRKLLESIELNEPDLTDVVLDLRAILGDEE